MLNLKDLIILNRNKKELIIAIHPKFKFIHLNHKNYKNQKFTKNHNLTVYKLFQIQSTNPNSIMNPKSIKFKIHILM
jgi:hypothetical protein